MPTVDKEELERLKDIESKMKERYRKQNARTNTIYDRINFTVPAGKKEEINAAAKASGKTLNAFCRDAILKAVSDISDDDEPDFMKE